MVIALALGAILTTPAVGKSPSWLSMLTDVAVDGDGRITGRSQHCDRIVLGLTLIPPN